MLKHKQIAIILFFLFLKIVLFAQNIFIKGLVLSEDSAPIQYATIYDGSIKSGTFSDSLGRFSIAISADIKELHVSAIGYKDKTMFIDQNDDLSDFRIVLLNDPFNLKEVVISPKVFKPKQTKIEPRKKTKGYSVICGYSYSHEIGLYLPNYEQIHGEIKSIEVYLNKENDETKHLIRLRIYSVDEVLIPERDVLLDNVLVNLKKSPRNQLVKINLEQYNISIPASGIVVAFESIHNTLDSNLDKSMAQSAETDKCSKIRIALVDDQSNRFTQWNRMNKEKWHNIDFAGAYKKHGIESRSLVPYVKLTINEYADQP